jgi:hypothetical protein
MRWPSKFHGFPLRTSEAKKILTVPFIVLPAEQAQFSALIDGILATADLSTISAKKIRKELQAKLTVDISDKKVGAFHLHRIPLRTLVDTVETEMETMSTNNS